MRICSYSLMRYTYVYLVSNYEQFFNLYSKHRQKQIRFFRIIFQSVLNCFDYINVMSKNVFLLIIFMLLIITYLPVINFHIFFINLLKIVNVINLKVINTLNYII